MKKANQYTEKDVKRRAYGILYSVNNILFNWDIRRHRLDMRYKFNKEVVAFLQKNLLSETERLRVKELRKQRAKNKPKEHTRIFDLPIVKDYMNNTMRKRGYLRSISDEGLHFYDGRNHWAKTEKDKRILAKLKAYHINKN